MVNRNRINQNPNLNNWPLWRLLLTLLNIIAIVLSIILSWHYFKEGAMPGCGAGSSCDQVLSSRWSSLAGLIPVSGLALGVYLAIFLTSFNISTSVEVSFRRLSWKIMLILGGAILGSAIWFTILQKWIIESFCIYCMTTHTIGFLLAFVIIWRLFKERDSENNGNRLIKPIQILGLVLVGIFLSGITAVVQFNYTPLAVKEENKTQSIQTNIDFQDAPLIGSKDAPYKVTLLFDYQCSHCQKIHFMLKSVVKQYNGKLAFVLSPTPLEKSCNPYIPSDKAAFNNSCELAKVGLAVWRANPEVFTDFENWMFTFDSGNAWHPRSLEAVKAKATQLLGHNNLNSALADPWVEQYMQNGIRMFGQTLQNGRGAIPKMIYKNTWLIPEPYNTNDLVMILQESLGVPKP